MADFNPPYRALQAIPEDVAQTLRAYTDSRASINARPVLSIYASTQDKQAAELARTRDMAALKRNTLDQLTQLQETRERLAGEAQGGIRDAMRRPPAPDPQTELVRELRVQAAWERLRPLIDQAGQFVEQKGNNAGGMANNTTLAKLDAVSGMAMAVSDFLAQALAENDPDAQEALVRESIPHAKAALGTVAERSVREVVQNRLAEASPRAAAAVAAQADIDRGMVYVARTFHSATAAVNGDSPIANIYRWDGSQELVPLLPGTDVHFGWSGPSRWVSSHG